MTDAETIEAAIQKLEGGVPLTAEERAEVLRIGVDAYTAHVILQAAGSVS